MSSHPYKSGNYAPVKSPNNRLETCTVTGSIPPELYSGMYVRNGSNPAAPLPVPPAAEPSYHWFDGDGMLAGVLFRTGGGAEFVNRYVLTDVFLSASPTASTPILPSIATLLAPLSHLHKLLYSISRAVVLTTASHLSAAACSIRRISVANTALVFHDGRALATCESGPPLWIRLPSLETVGWWDLEGDWAGEVGLREAGGPVLGWMREWCTAHPKRDPLTGELIVFHSSLLPPYLHYSVIPRADGLSPRILHAPVPIPASRMMHDCGASHNYTVLLDMPLSLSPLNLLTGVPVVSFSPTTRSRFGVLPRHAPQEVQWFTAPSCVIFHTALTYDTRTAVHLLCCQLNSSTLVYAAGNLPIPRSQVLPVGIEETCRLHYYRFPLDPPPLAVPTHSFPLSVIPFEFPCVPFGRTMEQARFVYGCSMTSGSFSAALGTAAKIDCLVKVKVQVLIQKGIQQGNAGEKAVDDRSISDILATKTERLSAGEETDLVRVFEMPRGWYAQEATFIPRAEQRDEDDGFLVTYVFDEAQLDPLTGEATATACSELWVIDAWNMVDVVAKIALPQRVPYGLHGTFFTADDIASQRAIHEIRSVK